ncbi:23450_t:CDS:1, partial [Cetraspora pellucida]
LLHYWPTPDINVYLACYLDPRCKRLHVLSTDERNQVEETLHAVYVEFKKRHCLSKQVTSLISKSVSMTNQNEKQAYRKGFIKSVFSPSLQNQDNNEVASYLALPELDSREIPWCSGLYKNGNFQF